jgi:glyceraldehyde 3-phosphate dehydrogenase
MTKRIAINGFGRIGRTIFRIIAERARLGKAAIEVVAVNDLTDVDTLAYLLKYDSIHGRYHGEIKVVDGGLEIDGKTIRVTQERDPSALPWKALEADVAFESTGLFTTQEKASLHLKAGAKKVVISAPADGADATICFGVNTNAYSPSMSIVSTASCTTNCIAPVAKIVNDAFGIKKASVTTIHSYTNDQSLQDMPHKDKRRARAAAISMIPTTTGAAKAVALVLPELAGKFDGMSIRVPTPNVSCIDMVALVSKDTTAEEINAKLLEASKGIYKGILGFTTDPVVSVDMMGTNESSIVDAGCTRVLGGNFIKIIAWYDNEWGFGNRAVDLTELVAKSC